MMEVMIMKLTCESLEEIIGLCSSQGTNSNLNSFINELQTLGNWFNENVLSELQKFLSEEYGITNDRQLQLVSLDIENDILDFLNSQVVFINYIYIINKYSKQKKLCINIHSFFCLLYFI